MAAGRPSGAFGGRLGAARRRSSSASSLAEEQRLAYLAALEEERRGLENRLWHVLQLGERKETFLIENKQVEGTRTGLDIAAQCEADIGAVDAEIERARAGGNKTASR